MIKTTKRLNGSIFKHPNGVYSVQWMEGDNSAVGKTYFYVHYFELSLEERVRRLRND